MVGSNPKESLQICEYLCSYVRSQQKYFFTFDLNLHSGT